MSANALKWFHLILPPLNVGTLVTLSGSARRGVSKLKTAATGRIPLFKPPLFVLLLFDVFLSFFLTLSPRQTSLTVNACNFPHIFTPNYSLHAASASGWIGRVGRLPCCQPCPTFSRKTCRVQRMYAVYRDQTRIFLLSRPPSTIVMLPSPSAGAVLNPVLHPSCHGGCRAIRQPLLVWCSGPAGGRRPDTLVARRLPGLF
jgi:hypothetical protein